MTRHEKGGHKPAVKYDASFREEHRLADGTVVALRLIRPEDKEELKRQFARLSPESKYRRFFQAVSELSDEALDYLTCVDGLDHFAVVATTDSLDLKREVGIGVGRFVRLDGDHEAAEAAVVVADDYQRRGVARLLLRALEGAAKERGIKKFHGEVLLSNAPMRRLLEEAGAIVGAERAGTVSFDIPIEEGATDPALLKVLRGVASLMLVWISRLHPKAGTGGVIGSSPADGGRP